MVGTLLPLQFGIPGGPELLIILLIAVLLFGANKIPKLARSTGEAMGEFQKGREEVEQELDEIRQGTTGTDTEGTTVDDAGPSTEGTTVDDAGPSTEGTTTVDDAGPSTEDTEIDDETEPQAETESN